MKIASKKIAAVLFIWAAVSAPQAYAWGLDGHRTVGAIADKLLTNTPTQKKLALLLKPGESLATVATWADCAKNATICRQPLTDEQKQFAEDSAELAKDPVAANPQHAQYH